MITVISGGTGSVKLLRGLDRVIDEEITIIANVGDNIWLYGLYICPDIDTVVYSLSQLLDEKRGWGIKDDTFTFLESYGDLGEENWFRVGDKDLATHILRTRLLSDGHKLSWITSLIAERFGIRHKVIPATNQSLETIVMTDEGEMHLQHYWVKRGGKPKITGIRYGGLEQVEPALGVTDSILKSEKVIITPGNPVSSIGPVISISSIKDALRKTKAKKVAVSPIIGDSPLSGPAAGMMRSLGCEVSPVGIAKFYSQFLDVLLINQSDAKLVNLIRSEGPEARTANIVMNNREQEDMLARSVLSV